MTQDQCQVPGAAHSSDRSEPGRYPWSLPYQCTACHRTAHVDYVDPQAGGTDAAARVQGWRLGTTRAGVAVRVCPECSGDDPAYWTSRTLDLAAQAGIAAGRAAGTAAGAAT